MTNMEKKTPEISVIIPVYNCERYLEDCLRSVAGQNFADWECIIIDDGSTDSSSEIYTRFSNIDKRFRIIKKENGGLSSARNAGIGSAKGNYLFFLDSDDTINPDCLGYMLGVARKTDCRIVAGHLDFSKNEKFKPLGKKTVRVYDYIDLISKVLYQKNNFDNCACAKLCGRNLFDDIRFCDSWFEDLDIFYRLYEKSGKIAVTTETVYFYRKHGDSFINSWSDDRLDIIPVVEGLDNYLSQKYPMLRGAATHRHFSACFNVFLGLAANGRSHDSVCLKCRDYICQNRRRVLFDRSSRIKNRLGALLSFAGTKNIITFVRCISRLKRSI